MKTTIYKGFSILAFIGFSLSSVAQGQITSTTSSSNTLTPEVAVAQAQVNKVLEDSGRYFRDGLADLKANKRSESG